MIFFVLSIVLLLMAHFVKIARQSQFIEIYEEPQDAQSSPVQAAPD